MLNSGSSIQKLCAQHCLNVQILKRSFAQHAQSGLSFKKKTAHHIVSDAHHEVQVTLKKARAELK